MNSTVARSFLSVFAAAGLALAADPSLLRFVPPDSAVIVGIAPGRIFSSPIAQSLVKQTPQQLGAAAMLEAIDEVLLAAPAQGQKKDTLVVVRGVMPPPLLELLKAGAVESKVDGLSVFTQKQKKNPLALAQIAPTLFLCGDPMAVRAALSRRDGVEVADPTLVAKARQLGAGYDLWFVARISPADLAAHAPSAEVGGLLKGDLIKAVQQFSGGLQFTSDLVIAADLLTRTPKEASELVGVLHMLLQMGAGTKQAKQIAPLLDRLRLSAESNTVRIALTIPEAELIKAMGQAGPPPSQEVTIIGEDPAPAQAASASGEETVITLPR